MASSSLHILPTRNGAAAENMALDFLLLQRYPENDAVRFRHYGWHRPAFTFGYSQKFAFVRSQLPPDEPFDLCRRPTGGGLVDHRDDWTFALVIPRGHSAEELRAAQSYQLVHEALAAALTEQNVPVILKTHVNVNATAVSDTELIAGVCFERAEVSDVIHQTSGAKIAGAAQKRNKHGLLFQGSISRMAVLSAAPNFDWDNFQQAFCAQMSSDLQLRPEAKPWPDLSEDELLGLTEQYASPEWLEHR